MSISNLTDRQLTTMQANYSRQGVTVGGTYTLAEVLLEKKRRTPSVLNAVEVASAIIRQARASDDSLTTYRALWGEFYPNVEWKGNNSQRIIRNALGVAIAYCVANRLPIVTALVVPSLTRKLTEKAVSNIYNEAKWLGVDVGLNAAEFVASQQKASLALLELPHNKLESSD